MSTITKNNIKNYNYSMNYKRNRLKQDWRKFISSQDYNVLATIQSPFIKKPDMLEDRFRKFSECDRTYSLFYSAERNADLSGYHIHLLVNAYELTKDILGYNLDLKPNQIPYYEQINDKVAVSRYVTKYMNSDQIHYNIY